MEYDHEYLVEQYAFMSRRNGSNGFQGCINKTRCGSYGFYLAKYSKEGLCERCESYQFPERFISCPFCRGPMRKYDDGNLSTCFSSCYDAMAAEIIEKFGIVPEDQPWKCIMRYFDKSKTYISRRFMRDTRDYHLPHILGMIYRGAVHEPNKLIHVWSRIHPCDSDKGFKMDDGFIGYLCIKYDIFGKETGDVFTGEISADDVTFVEKI